MRILIHDETLDGRPVRGSGIEVAGETHAELVAEMQSQSPFTASLPIADYCRQVMARVEPGRALPSQLSDEQVAQEFLSRLECLGRIAWLSRGADNDVTL